MASEPLFPGSGIPAPRPLDAQTAERRRRELEEFWNRKYRTGANVPGAGIPSSGMAPHVNTGSPDLDFREQQFGAMSPDEQFDRIQRLKKAGGAELDSGPVTVTEEEIPPAPEFPKQESGYRAVKGPDGKIVFTNQSAAYADRGSEVMGEDESRAAARSIGSQDPSPTVQGELSRLDDGDSLKFLFPRMQGEPGGQTLAGNARDFGGEGTFSQSKIENIPLGQRPESFFEDFARQAAMSRGERQMAEDRALTADPFARERIEGGLKRDIVLAPGAQEEGFKRERVGREAAIQEQMLNDIAALQQDARYLQAPEATRKVLEQRVLQKYQAMLDAESRVYNPPRMQGFMGGV